MRGPTKRQRAASAAKRVAGTKRTKPPAAATRTKTKRAAATKRTKRAVDGTVAAYIAGQPPEVRRALERVRQIVRKALPEAQETISYQIPTYKIDGRSVVYFAGWKEHWSLYPVTPRVRAALGAELDRYDAGKGTLRFPLSAPVPARLVQRVVRALGRTATSRRR